MGMVVMCVVVVCVVSACVVVVGAVCLHLCACFMGWGGGGWERMDGQMFVCECLHSACVCLFT